MHDLIEKLSDLRSRYNCFDENEYEAYHTLSEAIKVISEQPEPCEDAVSRKDVETEIANLLKRVFVEYKDIAKKATAKLPSVTPKLCEDAVSRQILLNDLKELITAWKKYPIMAEQIKGVETAIKYVEMVPSVTPKRKTWKWIVYYECPKCGGITKDFTEYCPFCDTDMRGEQDDD